MNKQQRPRRSWRSVGSHLGDKLMDAGNIVFGALIVGQLFSGQAFNWWIALGGVGVWIGFYILGALIVYWGGGDE